MGYRILKSESYLFYTVLLFTISNMSLHLCTITKNKECVCELCHSDYDYVEAAIVSTVCNALLYQYSEQR